MRDPGLVQPRSRETSTRATTAGAGLYGRPMASVKQIQVTFDCAEPERVARFWCEVLGYVVPPPPEGFATWDEFNRSLPPEKQDSAFACFLRGNGHGGRNLSRGFLPGVPLPRRRSRPVSALPGYTAPSYL